MDIVWASSPLPPRIERKWVHNSLKVRKNYIQNYDSIEEQIAKQKNKISLHASKWEDFR